MSSVDPIALGLPHREPFIFIDRVVETVPGVSAIAEKVFPLETDFFRGHFPECPIVPGVILTEALAQTAGIAAGQPGRSFRLSAIRGMKFPSAVRPGELISLEARKLSTVGALWQFEVIAKVGERTVAEGGVVLNEV
jgi:3-hydroxyacyl-[acyl-carrier-protein] dehydratase